MVIIIQFLVVAVFLAGIYNIATHGSDGGGGSSSGGDGDGGYGDGSGGGGSVIGAAAAVVIVAADDDVGVAGVGGAAGGGGGGGVSHVIVFVFDGSFASNVHGSGVNGLVVTAGGKTIEVVLRQ